MNSDVDAIALILTASFVVIQTGVAIHDRKAYRSLGPIFVAGATFMSLGVIIIGLHIALSAPVINYAIILAGCLVSMAGSSLAIWGLRKRMAPAQVNGMLAILAGIAIYLIVMLA